MADTGTTWPTRRAEKLYGDRLGRLRHSELSWHIAWKWLPALLLVGFVYGAIAELTGRPQTGRDPALFSDILLFLTTSALTGLVLWSITLFWSFRRVLVFDRGLLYGYAQKHTARAIFWHDIDPGSLRTVEAPVGIAADGLLKTLEKGGKTSLGVSGRYAVVFHGAPTALAAGVGASGPGFFTFSTDRTPDRLVTEIQRAMAESGIHRAGSPEPEALPPVPISSATRLD
ncbi:hypothetical protein [Arthrobacter oryzae]|uniref:hypothetical protein n=1 Tax=Arthrobacter oryzae TaxID=409290 RepID=UPI0028659B47|nr:hypothetical protein [Arthrobacter oryzae]MDR6504740.1 hypothetical protein [Arthrobacter oryzae]